MKLATVREGRTNLVVPQASLTAVPPTSPVFFNRAASVNRDVSVAITSSAPGKTFCDSLAGVGARGVRVAKEVRRKMEVTLVDFNRASLSLGRRSAKDNGVLDKCRFVPSETNSYLYSRYGRDEKFDFVDVDPFGTPVPYLQAVLRTTKDGGIASFTATDTAVLCGVHKQVALRRYGGVPLNNHFHHETGIRLLLNAIRREAATLDLGVTPVAAHSTRHYMRVFMRVGVGPAKADAALKMEGFVVLCRNCGHVSASDAPESKCPDCGKKASSIGPLWMGKVTEEGLLEKSRLTAERMGLAEAARILGSLRGLDQFPQWSFSIEKICSSLKVATVSEGAVVRALESAGFRCHRQPFETTGLKTDAEYSDVVAAVKKSVR